MMKSVFGILMACTLAFSLAACGQAANSQTTAESRVQETTETAVQEDARTQMESQTEQVKPQTEGQEEPAAASGETDTAEDSADTQLAENDSNLLIAYFSWSGNTEEMASYIQEQTGGDLWEIEPLNPYPTDYNETGDVAEKERDDNARPEIADLPEDLSQYDRILVGYPIWWHTAPMIIGTFLENYDLTGVEIYPFTQSASMNAEQFENSMDFVRENAPGANVHDGLFAHATDTEEIDGYLAENGLAE